MELRAACGPQCSPAPKKRAVYVSQGQYGPCRM
jgi:hypothetical protein